VKALDTLGYKAMYTHNLTGAGSVVGSPRGEFADASCNALEAVAAGLGQMTLNGSVATERYGIHQRFIAVVTDAPLDADEVKEGLAAACEGCDICRKACPTCALRPENKAEITLGGRKIPYLPVDANRCSWATKYALVCEEGNMYGGNFTNIPYPEELTEEKLAEALRQQDNVFKFRPVMGEKCIVTCPLKGRGTR
jgi:ferredoxin